MSQTPEPKDAPVWEFVDDRATFRLPEADRTRHLYFPLVGSGQPFASVTPSMAGDHAASHDSFLSVPSSVEALHESRWRRGVWLRIEGHDPWAADGGSARQRAARFTSNEAATVTAGPLWQMVARTHAPSGVTAELTSLVPPEGGSEVLHVTIRNNGEKPAALDVAVAVPIYGRSADNLRDHRHVTSLLNRARATTHGVVVSPTMIFDERGHRRGDTEYFVFGCDDDGQPPASVGSSLHDFTGERGDLDWPAAIVDPDDGRVTAQRDGDEVLAALTFAARTLQPGASATYSIVMGIAGAAPNAAEILDQLGAGSDVLERTRVFWDKQLDTLHFSFDDRTRDGWLRWVGIQPILRRHFGNSFLPYHDYGRGGRGWRDLWQDSLALLLMDNGNVEEQLYGHFAGVRMDGTNATIIGQEPGEFLADRNEIARVWMDHGAWPLLTVRLMLDRTGEISFLLRTQTYFRDRFVNRARTVDTSWTEDAGIVQRNQHGAVWQGTILEHLLIQHLTAYFNAGHHGCLRLEDADWNDGMDLGAEHGESVAFTALYAGNLADLADLVDWLREEGHESLHFASELAILLRSPVELDAVRRRAVLDEYVAAIADGPSDSTTVDALGLAARLRELSAALTTLVREQEWITDGDYGWFNGYYDNNGGRVEGRFGESVRMTLTGQAFPLMAGLASPEQAQQLYRSARTHLWSPDMAGFRLNTDFEEVRMDLGRAFGFAYGHKENGAMFTHMAVMFAFGLARYGMARESWELLDDLYRHTRDFNRSRMYPGLPEYVDPSGRGRYPWLTGSAAWFLHVMLSALFGVRGERGHLVVAPALPAAAFSDGNPSVTLGFAGRRLKVDLRNPEALEAGSYDISAATLGGQELPVQGGQLRVDRELIMALDDSTAHTITVHLGPRETSAS